MISVIIVVFNDGKTRRTTENNQLKTHSEGNYFSLESLTFLYLNNLSVHNSNALPIMNFCPWNSFCEPHD